MHGVMDEVDLFWGARQHALSVLIPTEASHIRTPAGAEFAPAKQILRVQFCDDRTFGMSLPF